MFHLQRLFRDHIAFLIKVVFHTAVYIYIYIYIWRRGIRNLEACYFIEDIAVMMIHLLLYNCFFDYFMLPFCLTSTTISITTSTR